MKLSIAVGISTQTVAGTGTCQEMRERFKPSKVGIGLVRHVRVSHQRCLRVDVDDCDHTSVSALWDQTQSIGDGV
jgi:hypothetical protein